ncbi:unnamed protein product [Brassica oleracea]
MFELLVILFPRYLVVFFYDSGKISIFAGLCLRKKSVSCRLMCIRVHFTSFNIIYQMTKKKCMKGVWSSGLSKCKRFIIIRKRKNSKLKPVEKPSYPNATQTNELQH